MSDLNKDWGAKLKDAFIRAGGAKRRIRLPEPGKIDFGGTSERVMIHMKAEAVVANMQTDESAFEAWSLALVAWCGVKSVFLTWDPPKDSLEDLKRQLGDEREAKRKWDRRERHYQRFLYRAHHFSKLFCDWFRLGRSTDGARTLAEGKFVINAPIDPREKGGGDHNGEAALERNLQSSESFRDYFGLGGKIHRQFPVGVFDGEVKDANRLFSGGKSAIDLVGTSGNTLVVFEIKDAKNTRAGILSELLFYTCVMRDAIPVVKGGRSHFQIGAHLDVSGIDRIRAVLLAPKFHPLVGHRSMLQLLNTAKCGKRVSIEFAAATLVPPARDDEDYKFKPLPDEGTRA